MNEFVTKVKLWDSTNGKAEIEVGYLDESPKSWDVRLMVIKDGHDMPFVLTSDQAKSLGQALIEYARMAAAAQRRS